MISDALSDADLKALWDSARSTQADAKLENIVGQRISEALTGLVETESMTVARRWLESPLWCLAMLGGLGNGKSTAAGWLVRSEVLRRGSVCWIRAEEASTASLYGPEADARRKRARTSDLLVIDDLGAELASEPWRSWLGDVLGARYANCDRTVITSNLDAEAFKARVGARLADRIREGMVVGTTAGSMRRKP